MIYISSTPTPRESTVDNASRMKQLPLCVTVAEISGKFLMDVTSEEEMCAEVR